jgi:hypothetical protein
MASKEDLYYNNVPFGLLSYDLQEVLERDLDSLLVYEPDKGGRWVLVDTARLENGIVYRTIKAKPKPREFWLAVMGPPLSILDIQYEKPNDPYGYIHVREVIE